MQTNPATEFLFIDDIIVSDRHRPVDADAVKVLAASLESLGLRTPITIRSPSVSECYLVAGRHRLEAARLLGWEKIECFVLDCSEDEAEMWEISENLHRSGLTKEQRDAHIRRFAELLARRNAAKIQIPQNAAPEIGYKKPPPQTKGIAAQIAEQTGLSKDTVQRALAQKPVSPPSNFPSDDHERSIKWRRAFERVWNDSPSLTDREWALEWVDRPIMDKMAS